MSSIIIAGVDGALANFGMVKMEYDLLADRLMRIVDMRLVETEKSKVKSVRASSDNLARATSIQKALQEFLTGTVLTFGEVPTGGQSAKAVLSFGIVIGLYSGIRNFAEVSPYETKLATVGTKTASKEEMINWAFTTYPSAKWLTTKRGGEMVPTKKNEHLADAAAICHAGIKLPVFQQVKAILASRALQAA